jgi:hypothetical protein
MIKRDNAEHRLSKEAVAMSHKEKVSRVGRKVKRQVLFFKAIYSNVSTLVFATPEMAEGHDKVMKALERSKTWGEFRMAIPASEFKEIKQLFREREGYTAAEIREIIAEDQPFHAGEIPGVEDAEYPSMIASIQRTLLPKEIAEKYCQHWGAFNCNDIWQIDVRHREAILLDLEALGYEVIERSDLDFF